MSETPTVRVGLAGLLALASTYGPGRQAYGLFAPGFRAEFTLGLDAIGYLAGGAQFSYLVATAATGAIAARFGPRLPVVTGCVLLAAGAARVATAGSSVPLAIGVVATYLGRSFAPVVAAVPAAVMSVAPPVRRRPCA